MESEDQIAELCGELAKIQEALTELCPDMEKLETNFSTYPEIAAALVRQNMDILERMRQLVDERAQGEDVEQLKAQYNAVQGKYEDETIEDLVRQVELYKSKSGTEVDRKIAARESKAMQEAKSFKLENERLQEMLVFKEEKVSELQQEIDRLKLVMRVEAVPTSRKLPTVSSLSKLEKKIDEAAAKGRLEYHVVLTEGENIDKDHRVLEKIMTLPAQSVAKLALVQARMLEENEKRVEDAVRQSVGQGGARLSAEIKGKFAELTKERAAIERRLNAVMEAEKTLMARFNQIAGILQELSADEKQVPQAETLKKKILALRDEWKESLRYSSSDEDQNEEGNKGLLSDSPIHSIKGSLVQTSKEGEEAKESAAGQEKDIAGVETVVEKHVETGNLTEAAEELRTANYELPGQNVESVIQKLRLVCKVRDKQIEKLSSQIASAETAKKCAELDPDEVQDILTDYEAVKAKYAVEAAAETKQQDERIAELESQLKSQQAVAEQPKVPEGKTSAVEESQEKSGPPQETQAVISELSEQLEEAKRLIKQKDDRIEELELAQPEGAASVKGESSSHTGQKRDSDVGTKKDSRGVSANGRKKAGTEDTKSMPAAMPASVAAVVAENEKNRALIKELMTSSGPAAQVKANKALCESNAELNDKLRTAAEETDSLRNTLEDLSAEHTVAVSKLEQILNSAGRRSPRKAAARPAGSVEEMMLQEIEAARRISLLATELSFASAQGEFVVSPESVRLYESQAEKPRAEANDLYKEFFSEERTPTMTLDSLLDRLKRKNAAFKSLFRQYEGAIAQNEVMMKSLAAAQGQDKIQTPAQSSGATGREAAMGSGKRAGALGTMSSAGTVPVPGRIMTPAKGTRVGVAGTSPASMMSPSKQEIGELKRQNDEQTATIKQLLTEIQGLKTAVESRIAPAKVGAAQLEFGDSNLLERAQALEAELRLSNAQLQETTAELEKRDATLKQKDRTIDSLEVELKHRMDDIKQLDYQTQAMCSQPRRPISEDPEAEAKLFKTKYERANEAYERADEALSAERGRQYEIPHLIQENQELGNMNKVLRDKIAELNAQLAAKAEDVQRLSAQNKELAVKMDEQKAALEAAQRSSSEVHGLLTQNMSEYKKASFGHKEEVQMLREKLTEKDLALGQWGKVLQKLKGMRLETVGVSPKATAAASMGFYTSRAGPMQQEEAETAATILDEQREQLLEQKRRIESLQSAVNALQGERQMLVSPAKSGGTKATPTPAKGSSASPTKTGDPLKSAVQKYERWIESLQEPARNIADVLEAEHETGEFSGTKRPQKFNLREIREIIARSSTVMERLRDRASRKAEENAGMKAEVQRARQQLEMERGAMEKGQIESNAELEARVLQLTARLAELEAGYDRTEKEKARLESMLQKQRLESGRLYDKVKEEMQEKQRESLETRLEKAKEEGMLLGQKQQRGYREEELRRLDETAKEYKAQCEKLKGTIAEMTESKKELEQYNKKANDEIVVLLDTLRLEQEKQKQLSTDLEALTKELKTHRISKTSSSAPYDSY